MHGFTILLPRGWSMYLLQSIAYTGTLAGGLAERRTQHREAGVHCFPEHYGAVCKAGTEWEKKKGIEEEERWSRKPPGKRAEWGSMGTRDPFIPDWTEIMDVSLDCSHILVLLTTLSMTTTLRPKKSSFSTGVPSTRSPHGSSMRLSQTTSPLSRAPPIHPICYSQLSTHFDRKGPCPPYPRTLRRSFTRPRWCMCEWKCPDAARRET
jgi:hypothetical protein